MSCPEHPSEVYFWEVIAWNANNKHVCSPSKTETIQFGSCFVIKNPILTDCLIGNVTIKPSL